MAFQIFDVGRLYIHEGDNKGLFNIARSDYADPTHRYYAYFNEEGSFIIQKITIAASIVVYEYYADKTYANFATAWAGRAGLTYKEYPGIFGVA